MSWMNKHMILILHFEAELKVSSTSIFTTSTTEIPYILVVKCFLINLLEKCIMNSVCLVQLFLLAKK